MFRLGSLERGGKRTRKGVKSGMGRLERIKHGSGINDRDDSLPALNSVIHLTSRPTRTCGSVY